MILLKTPRGQIKLSYSSNVVSALKVFARFDPASKVWVSDAGVPCWFAHLFKLSVPDCVRDAPQGRWWRGVAYVWGLGEEEVKKKACFAVERWQKTTCDEYCEERCADAWDSDRCEDRCVERCEEEGWRPAVKIQQEVCLARKADDGSWQVPRGLVPLFHRPMPKFAELGSAEMHPDLRFYQVDVIYSAWHRLEDVGAATIQMATGAGKSYTSGYLAKLLAERGYHVFLTAMQLDLVYQLKEFAERWGAPADKIHAVTVQTLYRRLTGRSVAEDAENEEDREAASAYADESEMTEDEFSIFANEKKVAVIMDEAHHIPARTVKEVMSAAGGGWALRIGLTATPWRNDNRDLEIYAYAGVVVEPRITSSFLIEHDFAVPVEIRIVKAPRCLSERMSGAEGWAKELKALVECEARNRLIADIAQKAEKPALVITNRVKHAELLGKMLKEAGLRAAVVTGAVKGEVRKKIYDDLRAGRIEALAATTLADEGLDLPPLRTLIIAVGGRSKTRTLQRIGRLVRPYEGKKIAVAYELEDPTGFARAHLQERLKLYKTEPHWRIIHL
jgi:superfamily II DNA or RNA helicase